MPILGTYSPPFAEVAAEFERNFAERGEVGASVSVTVDGQTVVDLWAGVTDPATGAEWSEDTLVDVWSCTKGATALCAHILASRGELDLNAPVAKYWPEFAQNGKEAVLVHQLLDHQAGLSGVREPLPEGAFFDWEKMTGLLAAAEPLWAPGTTHGYHGLTFGFLVGEVVRRVSGRPLAQFFAEEVAGPLGLDFWLSLPESEEHRVAPTLPPDMTKPGVLVPSLYLTAMADPATIPGLMVLNTGGYLLPSGFNSREAHASTIGAVGACTNARGLAGMYRPLALGGTFADVQLVKPSQVAIMGQVTSACSMDAAVLVPTRFARGFGKTTDNRHLAPNDQEGILLSEEAFGHSGMGGALGFADLKAKLSFGYAMNQQGTGIGVNERGQSLVDATYRALGYHQMTEGGSWFKQ
ncbi:CubicO group peptidase (beta-lactamase class C family) [Kibdelosporangium banguiense]|uniref:CubicO group peptidase (Beta-lactamase class C family) n=1 Tax=Kibdelosporangium banguiense TaxID=1365924 RepID=A0ABS4TZV5_9PSEU|nr:serine hydrolase domain-containing protein [Kibdelosporangium banguiense]MBP2329942.1 CubicO group peptidase (beta-lactamase class C family) [Kibdelosporangium banguiense]